MNAHTLVLAPVALLVLAPAAFAVARKNLVHGALLLTASWAGVAAFYLWAGAEFVAFAQILIYVGAISMVVLFAVVLTGRSDPNPTAPARGRAAWAALAAVLAGAVIIGADAATPLPAGQAPELSLRALGETLAGPQAAALLAVGALLTVALLGAIVLAAAGRARGDEP